MRAAPPGGTVDEVCSVCVELIDAGFEIGCKEIDVCCGGNMGGLEFARRPEIEYDHLFLSDQLLRLIRIDVFDGGVRNRLSRRIRDNGGAKGEAKHTTCG